jgi:hypothetical protein
VAVGSGQVKYVSPQGGTGLFQYFIKVIPTDYKASSGGSILNTQGG